MTFSATCYIVLGVTGGICKYDKRHLLYIYNICELIIIIVDGHGSSFNLEFLPYICDGNQKCTVVFGITYGTSSWKVGDSVEKNGTCKINLVKAKHEILTSIEVMIGGV